MPKQNRISILISKFLRVNEDVDLNDLSEGDIPLMTDMVLDNPYGKPHTRGGFEEINSNSASTNVGKIIDVKSKNGTNYMLAGISTLIQRSVGAAWTTIKSGLTSSGGEYGYFRHTAFGDDILITNLLDKPFRLAGDDLSTTTDLEIEKPDLSQVSIRSVNSDVGELEESSAGYYYMMVYVTEVGERSNPSLALSCVTVLGNHTASVTDKQKYLSNLPVPTDDRITSKWLYRTESWDGVSTTGGRIFYLRKKLDIGATTFVDGAADIDLDFSESVTFSRVPETAQHIAQSNNRVWLGNVSIHQKTFFEPILVPLSAPIITVDDLVYSSAIWENLSPALVGTTAYDLNSLVTNGILSTDTIWTKGTGWTIAAGVASCSGAQSADSDLSQEIKNYTAPPNGDPYRLVPNRTYDVSFDIINYSAGNATFVVGGTEGTDRSANGTHTESIVAGDDGTIAIRADLDFIGDIDNVLIGAGGLTAAKWYQYICTYVDINGYESEPAYGIVFQVDAGTLEELVLMNVPVAQIGANASVNNPDIKFRRLYRTEGQTSSFTANTLPFKLVVEEDIRHDEPPVHFDGDALQFRIFDDLSDARLGATYAEVIKEAKSTIVWSQVDRPSYMLAENIKSIFKDDQDELTGIIDDGNGVLIFKENSIIKLSHTGASQNWYLRKVWSEFGCDEPKSLKKAGNVIYFRHRNRPYAYVSGGAPKYIGFGKQTFLDTVTVRDVEATDKWIIWMVEDGDNLDYMVIYDTIVKTWYQFNLHRDPVGYVLKSVMVKKYDDFFTKGNIYIQRIETYEYDETSTTDDFTPSPDTFDPVIQLPRVKLDILTKSKLRDIVVSLQRQLVNAIDTYVQTEDTLDIHYGMPPVGERVQRITGIGSIQNSSYFDITFMKGIKQLDAVRVDLRPVRSGVGSI